MEKNYTTLRGLINRFSNENINVILKREFTFIENGCITKKIISISNKESWNIEKFKETDLYNFNKNDKVTKFYKTTYKKDREKGITKYYLVITLFESLRD